MNSNPLLRLKNQHYYAQEIEVIGECIKTLLQFTRQRYLELSSQTEELRQHWMSQLLTLQKTFKKRDIRLDDPKHQKALLDFFHQIPWERMICYDDPHFRQALEQTGLIIHQIERIQNEQKMVAQWHDLQKTMTDEWRKSGRIASLSSITSPCNNEPNATARVMLKRLGVPISQFQWRSIFLCASIEHLDGLICKFKSNPLVDPAWHRACVDMMAIFLENLNAADSNLRISANNSTVIDAKHPQRAELFYHRILEAGCFLLLTQLHKKIHEKYREPYWGGQHGHEIFEVLKGMANLIVFDVGHHHLSGLNPNPKHQRLLDAIKTMMALLNKHSTLTPDDETQVRQRQQQLAQSIIHQTMHHPSSARLQSWIAASVQMNEILGHWTRSSMGTDAYLALKNQSIELQNERMERLFDEYDPELSYDGIMLSGGLYQQMIQKSQEAKNSKPVVYPMYHELFQPMEHDAFLQWVADFVPPVDAQVVVHEKNAFRAEDYPYLQAGIIAQLKIAPKHVIHSTTKQEQTQKSVDAPTPKHDHKEKSSTTQKTQKVMLRP